MALSSSRWAAATVPEEAEEREEVVSPSMSASARLRRAREAHEAMRQATRTAQEHQSVRNVDAVSPIATRLPEPVSTTASPSASIAQLASQLEALHQSDKSKQHGDVSDENNDSNFQQRPSMLAALAKIGAEEKDQLLLHLLEQCDALRSQRDEATALGEGIAAQLVRQQHELRQKCRQRVDGLERDLHSALHAHPEVAALKAQVRQLTDANHELEQQLRFSVVKLQRSRNRERELKRLHDPLWDI